MKRAEKIIKENANILAEEEYILSTIAQHYCIVDDKLIGEPINCGVGCEFGDFTYCLDNILKYLKQEVEE